MTLLRCDNLRCPYGRQKLICTAAMDCTCEQRSASRECWRGICFDGRQRRDASAELFDKEILDFPSTQGGLSW